jgi:hypothetical protein
VNITREAVQLGYDHCTPSSSCFFERCGKLWPAVERVSALARFNFRMEADDLKPLSLRKVLNRLPLRLQPKPLPASRQCVLQRALNL